MESGEGRRFYERQIELLRGKDVDLLIEEHYAPDAVVVGFDFVRRGHEELKAHFRQYLDMLGEITVRSTDKFIETEDAIFFEASVTTALGDARVYDAFVIRDGRITHHFTGVM